MKNKIFQSSLLALLAILVIVPQAIALEIYVDDYGTIRFYQGDVLGDDDNKEEDKSDEHDDEEEKEDEEDESDDDEDEDEKEDEEDESDDDEDEDERVEIRESEPVKTLYSSTKKIVKFKSEDDGSYKIEIEDGDNKYKIESHSKKDGRFIKKEEIEIEDLDFSFPSDAKTTRSMEDRVDYFKQKYAQRTDVQGLNDSDKEAAIEKRQEDYKLYLEKLREERKKRSKERVEIRNRSVLDDSGSRFEIQSRNTKAKLQGADFSYDSATGEIIMTTPSGQEHFLQHLPDQAIERMSENGFFVDENQEIEIETTEDGQVKYKSPGSKRKRFLGLFDREVDTEVILDDLTGEIVETEAPKNAFESILNALSI